MSASVCGLEPRFCRPQARWLPTPVACLRARQTTASPCACDRGDWSTGPNRRCVHHLRPPQGSRCLVCRHGLRIPRGRYVGDDGGAGKVGQLGRTRGAPVRDTAAQSPGRHHGRRSSCVRVASIRACPTDRVLGTRILPGPNNPPPTRRAGRCVYCPSDAQERGPDCKGRAIPSPPTELCTGDHSIV
jgi:hypothetical protein